MSPATQQLDLILETRLDVLAQAVDEVKGVIEAMSVQRNRLTDVEQFLTPRGTLKGAEDELLTHLGYASTELGVLLRETARPVAPAVTRLIGPDSGTPSWPESAREKRLQAVLDLVQKAQNEVEAVAATRETAYGSFQDVRRWSVAGLVDSALKDAVRDYQRLIDEIRKAKEPWPRYQNEMPRRGHELFTRYLEMLAGMAVRGFGLDANIMSDVQALIQQLMEPLNDEDKPLEHQRSPLALMGSLGKRHVPLGYPEWSLWALPLVGRTVGELVVTSFIQGDVEKRLRILCADLYAQYVLGPSYLHAAVFLEFDPSPEPAMPDAPPDPLRATLLLEKLPQLGGGKYPVLQQVADGVAQEWARARSAVGGDEPTLDDAGRKVVEDFLEELAKEYPDVAYDVRYVEENAANGRLLAAEPHPEAEEQDALPKLAIRDLISAMWLARLENSGKARLIHKHAKIIAQRGRIPSLTRAGRISQAGGETWAF
jgi:hypothetical protein